jgi:hypothetical protein
LGGLIAGGSGENQASDDAKNYALPWRYHGHAVVPLDAPMSRRARIPTQMAGTPVRNPQHRTESRPRKMAFFARRR